MSRLIDAKELINSRPENLNTYIDNDIESAYNKGWNACNSFWLKIIEEQLTAYDIDKVAEQLEGEIELVVNDYPLQGRYIKKSRAVEIVKGGAE